MKILIINYEFPPLGTGGSTQSFELAKRFAKEHEVYFLTAGFNAFGIEHLEGFQVERLQTFRKNKDRCSTLEMLIFLFRAWFRLPSILKTFQPDIAQIFYVIPTGLLSFHPCMKKVPFIVTSLGSDVPGHNLSRFKWLYLVVTPFAQNIWKKAARVVANSTGLKREIHQVLPEIAVEVIPSGINLSTHMLSDELLINKSQSHFTALFVGRLIPLKRVDLAIKAIAKVAQSSPVPVQLRIVGSGESESDLKALAERLKISSQIKFLGFVSEQELKREYQNADLYIQLSTAEGMSISILEAMTAGIPIMSTLVGGTEELIQGNGIVVEPDPEKIAAHISQLIQNRDRCLEMGEKSQEVATQFDFANITAKYLGLFNTFVVHE